MQGYAVYFHPVNSNKMTKDKDIRSPYEKGLISKIKEIADDAQRLIEQYEDIKTLSYSSKHKFLFEQMKAFIDSRTA